MDWEKKQDPTFCCLQETYLTGNDIQRLKVKGWIMIFQTESESKKEWLYSYLTKQTSRQN
jgi:hypothetical protein